MNAIQKITKNISTLFIAQIFSYIIGFIYTIYLVRYLGVGNYGILSFALALTSILGIIPDFGLNILMTREIAKEKSLTIKYVNNVFSIKLLLISILVLLTFLILSLSEYSPQIIYVIYFMVIFMIFNTFSIFYSWLFQSYEKLQYQSIAVILNSLLMFVGVLILIYYNSSLVTFSFLYAVVGVLILVYYLIISKKSFGFSYPKIEIDWDFWKVTIKTAAPFGFMGVFMTIYVMIDSVMLFFMQGNQAVGLYNAAYRIVLLLIFIPTVINTAIFPVMSRLYISSRDSLKKIVEKYFKYMIMIGIPIGVVITLLANQIIILIYGSPYLGSAPALQILIWATVLTYTNAAFVQLFQATNKQMLITKITFITMMVNIILNLILIPKFSYIAASFNTLITELIIGIIVLILANRLGYFVNVKKLLKDFVKIIIAAIIMMFFILLFENLYIVILISLSAILYVIVLFVLKGIDNEDVNIIKSVLK